MSFNTIVFLIIIVGLAFLVLKLWYKEKSKQIKTRKRFERGRELEAEAYNYLIKKGYKVIAGQKEYLHTYYVDEIEHTSKIKIDYLVSKNGKTYVVEVKSGSSAISASNSNTRRQLLEYDYVIKNDGVFLLDMENKKMQKIVFQTKETKQNIKIQIAVGVILIFAIILPFWSYKIVAIVIFALYGLIIGNTGHTDPPYRSY